jgi:branched-chain amino acid transport system substrate-binding protein
LDDGTPYGKDLAAGAAVQLKAAQKSIVVTQSFDDKTTAFDDQAQKLKAEGVEAIVSTLNDFQVVALFEALKKVNYSDVALLGGDTIKTTLMRKGVAPGQRLFATSPILEVGEFPAGQAFLDKYRAKFKIDPAYAGHYTYDATYVLAAAIRRTQSAKPAAIVEALRKLDGYAPVTGSMKWDAKGEQRYGVIGVYRTREGVWESQVRSDVW